MTTHDHGSPRTSLTDGIAAILERAAAEIRELGRSSPDALALLREREAVHDEPAAAASAMEPAKTDLLTPASFAELLHVDSRTLRRLRTAGEVPPPIMIGGSPRWWRSAVDRWLAERSAG